MCLFMNNYWDCLLLLPALFWRMQLSNLTSLTSWRQVIQLGEWFLITYINIPFSDRSINRSSFRVILISYNYSSPACDKQVRHQKQVNYSRLCFVVNVQTKENTIIELYVTNLIRKFKTEKDADNVKIRYLSLNNKFFLYHCVINLFLLFYLVYFFAWKMTQTNKMKLFFIFGDFEHINHLYCLSFTIFIVIAVIKIQYKAQENRTPIK